MNDFEQGNHNGSVAAGDGLSRHLVDVMPTLVCCFDAGLVCTFLNARYRDWFGVDPEDYLGSHAQDLFGEKAYSVMASHLQQGLSTPHIYEAEVPFLHGGTRFIRGYLTPYTSQTSGEPGIICTYLDITREKRAEVGLTKARDDAVAATAAKSRFLAAASHDLRQPLHSMTLFTSALSRRASTEDMRELVGNMQVTLRSLHQMFNALLDVTKLDAGIVSATIEDFPIGDVFDQIRSDFIAQANVKELPFRLVPSSAIVRSDKVLLETMVRNLVSNAIKFTPGGKVIVGTRRHNDDLRIEVWDTGPGVPSDRLDVIFEEFERYNRTANAGQEGLGLGLAIVRRLARLLGHEVSVQSVVGKGSVFRIQVPLVTTNQVTVSSGLEVGAPDWLQDKSILIVDDDPMITTALTQELKDHGADVMQARGHVTAQQVVANNRLPDLVIADLHLGTDMNGVELLDRLSTSAGTKIPAIVITGSTDAETLAYLKRSHYVWLTKPVSPGDLHRTISEVLSMGLD